MSALGHFNYWVVIFLMMVGFYTLIARGNLVKKLIGLSIFQTSVFILYISLGKIRGGTAPIWVGGGHGEEGADDHAADGAEEVAGAVADTADHAVEAVVEAGGHAAEVLYSNPIPHVLILTAIVVGVATLALGLSLVIRINEAFGTIEEDEIEDDAL